MRRLLEPFEDAPTAQDSGAGFVDSDQECKGFLRRKFWSIVQQLESH